MHELLYRWIKNGNASRSGNRLRRRGAVANQRARGQLLTDPRYGAAPMLALLAVHGLRFIGATHPLGTVPS